MDDLFSKKEQDYGVEYQNHLFEQYKLFIESVEKTSDRRQQANNYFITINTALISFIGLSFQINLFKNLPWLKILFAVLGIVICFVFYFLIKSYKQLNTGKFAVIHEIEKHLPLALYKYEWQVLGEGKDKTKYYPFSHVELWIPRIFGILYLALGICFVVLLFK